MSTFSEALRWLELGCGGADDVIANLRRELAEREKRTAELLEENEAHLERIAALEGQVERLREQPTPAPPSLDLNTANDRAQLEVMSKRVAELERELEKRSAAIERLARRELWNALERTVQTLRGHQ